MLAAKAWSLPKNEAPERGFTWAGYSLTRKYQTRPEWLAKKLSVVKTLKTAIGTVFITLHFLRDL
jgi:hypothetical protein